MKKLKNLETYHENHQLNRCWNRRKRKSGIFMHHPARENYREFLFESLARSLLKKKKKKTTHRLSPRIILLDGQREGSTPSSVKSVKIEIVWIRSARVHKRGNARRSDPPGDRYLPVAAQESPEDSGIGGMPGVVVPDTFGVSPGRSAIRRDPRARKRCESRRNSRPRPRPSSRRFAESWSDVVGCEWSGQPVDEWRGRGGGELETSGGQSFRASRRLYGLSVRASKHEHDAQPDLRTGDCELTEPERPEHAPTEPAPRDFALSVAGRGGLG